MSISNKKTLEKAIQKAIDGGWKPECMNDITNFKASIRLGQGFVRWFNNEGMEVIENVERVIFNHDFAKALWGEKRWSDQPAMHQYYDTLWDGGPDEFGYEGRMWQYHLQAMVIDPDPIKYLGEHLDG